MSKRGNDNWRTSLCSDGGIDRALAGLIQTHGSTIVHLELISILSACFGLKNSRERSFKVLTWSTIMSTTSRINIEIFLCFFCVSTLSRVFICVCLCICMLAAGLLICKGECMLKFKVGFLSRLFPLADRAPCRSACTPHTLCSLIH